MVDVSFTNMTFFSSKRSVRYTLLLLVTIILLHGIFSFSFDDYRRKTSLSNIASHFAGADNDRMDNVVVPTSPCTPSAPDRANATFVILARNSDLDGTVQSIRDMEDRFNRRHGYPYVFLNEVPFTDEFKTLVGNVISSQVEFGVIPHDHWFQPKWINETRAAAGRQKLTEEHVIYGESVSYRNMCRFNAGFFFKHELLQKYRYYWRIEPNVHYHCHLEFDPFVFMRDNGKVYSFTITMYEYEKTIPTLWQTVKDFMTLHPEFIAEDNTMGFMSSDGGNTYNLCHFWSNFEIADMDFWRGPAYTAFFEYLEATGGFYYERWGDAPVHSIAAGIFLPRNQIHFFDEIGYEHPPYTHCPKDKSSWVGGKCSCDRAKSFDYDGYSCMKQWDKFVAG